MLNHSIYWSASGNRGENARIALLDTGVDTSHPDLKEAEIILKDFSNSATGIDTDGHGTHCAGIILQPAPVSLVLSGRIMSQSGLFTFDGLSDGLYWASSQSADLICICSGERFSNQNFQQLISDTTVKGCQIVAAIGNDGEGGIRAGIYPARYPEVIAAGSTNSRGELSPFTDLPTGVDVFCVPGEDVTAPWLNNQYATLSGTSVSASLITGYLALLVSRMKKNNQAIVPGLLKQKVRDASTRKESDRGPYYLLDPLRLF